MREEQSMLTTTPTIFFDATFRVTIIMIFERDLGRNPTKSQREWELNTLTSFISINNKRKSIEDFLDA